MSTSTTHSQDHPRKDKFVSYDNDDSKKGNKISRDVAKRWLQKISNEEVDNYQHEKSSTSRNYGRFNRKDIREIRRRVIHRVMRDGGDRYGFVTVGWLLMVALASCISWAIKKWLDRVLPGRSMRSIDYDVMLDELRKE